MKKCEIAIFLEHHDDKGGTEAISSLLAPLKARGYINYLFEEPSDENYVTTTNALKMAKNYYLNVLLDDDLKSSIESKGYIGLTNKKLANLLANSKNIPNLEEIGRQYRGIKESYEATLKLLNSIHNDSDLSIYNIDMPRAMREEHEKRYASEDQIQTRENLEKRNEYMADQAQEICQNSGNKQVLMIGLSHHGIGEILENHGFTVKKIAVFDDKPITIEDLYQAQDLPQSTIDDVLYSSRVRDVSSSEYKAISDLTLIDLYQSPDLNYANMILGLLDKYIQPIDSEF